MTKPSSKLIHILIGKAIIETVLVGGFAVWFNVTAFPPTFHGWGEAVSDTRSIAGWAVNSDLPWERVQVQLFVDDKFAAYQSADLSRIDVKQAGWAKDEWHGYNFQIIGSNPGQHVARVYAVHKSGGGARYSLQLLGDPINFSITTDGALTK